MVQVEGRDWSWRLLSRAIVVWTGWGVASTPQRDESLLVDCFGGELAVELLPLVRELEDSFYLSDARFSATDLQEMSAIASAQFRARHPEIGDAAVQALAWCYTYDYK